MYVRLLYASQAKHQRKRIVTSSRLRLDFYETTLRGQQAIVFRMKTEEEARCRRHTCFFVLPASLKATKTSVRGSQNAAGKSRSSVPGLGKKAIDAKKQSEKQLKIGVCVSFVRPWPPRGAARPCRSFWHVGGARIRHGDGSIQHQGVVLWGWLAGNTRGLLPLPDGGENVRVFYSTPALDPEVAPYSSILFLRSEGPFSLFEFVKLPVGRQNPLDFSTVFSFSPDIIFFCFVSSTLFRSEFQIF